MLQIQISFISGMMLGIEFPNENEQSIICVIDLVIFRFILLTREE